LAKNDDIRRKNLELEVPSTFTTITRFYED
jgi:hypothetical protein